MRALLFLAATASVAPFDVRTASDPAPEQAEADRQRWSGEAFQTGWRPELPLEERMAGLALLWAEVRYGFANFDLVPEVDWDAEYLAMIPRVAAAESTDAYYALLAELAAKLRDGHTSITPPRELQRRGAIPGLLTELVEDRVVVAHVLGAEFLDAEIERGDELVTIDGVEVRAHADARIRPYQSSSTPHHLDRIVFEWRLLEGPVGPVELGFRTRDGDAITVASRRLSAEEWEFVPVQRPADPPAYRRTMLPGDVAYVELNSFVDSTVRESFAADFDEIARAKAVILDVRRNLRGNGAVGFDVLAHFTDAPFAVSSWGALRYSAVRRAWGRPAEFERRTGNTWRAGPEACYRGPVIVLTSAHTFSAAEDFAAAFDALGRGKIVGETTAGSTGQPLSFRLPGGGYGRFTAKRDTYPDGSEFVGRGIAPDVAAAPTIEDFVEGVDTVLERALEVLAERWRSCRPHQESVRTRNQRGNRVDGSGSPP
ncbi:MAG: S41 family peptidase [Planctomycetota bacterium]